MSWLHYLMEANLYLVLFYLCYCLFLNRETHYTLNRAYLLFSCVAAFVLPILQLGMLKPVPQVTAPVNYAATTAVPLTHTPVTLAAPVTANRVFTWDDGLLYIYLIGAGIFLLVLLFKLHRLALLARAGRAGEQQGYRLVRLNETNTAFSFFKYLFIGAGTASADTIIRHELVHIRQKHSADIIFIELLKVINWFNPVIYLMQRSLRAVHEYIADEQTASSGNGALAYSSFLVENAYGLSGTSVTHSFFNYNLLKKRIIMLHQKRSGKLARLKYLVTLPVCAGMLCASTLAFSKTYGWVDIAPKRNIDSAHLQNRYDVWNKSVDSTFTTSKGYKVHEKIIFIDGAVSKTATIYDKDGHGTFYDDKTIPAATHKILYEKYGYQFPIDTVMANVGPGQDINANLAPDTNKYASSSAKKGKRVRFPLPHPMPYHTDKGYAYSEAYYNENGKIDILVTIKEKNGYYIDFDKMTAKPKDIEYLKDKFGYVFPAGPNYPHLPAPPPPAAPKNGARTAVKFPPPVVRGAHPVPPPPATPPAGEHKAPPPPPASPADNGSAKVTGDKVLTRPLIRKLLPATTLKEIIPR